MNLRRVRALALVSTAPAVAAGFATPVWSSSAAHPAVCSSIPAGAALVLPSASGVVLAAAGEVQPLVDALPTPATIAVRGPDGTIWASAPSATGHDVYRVPASGGPAAMSASGDIALTSVGALDDRTAAVIIDRSPGRTRPDETDFAGAVLVEYADGSQVDTGPTTGPEFRAVSVSIGAGRLVAGSFTDLTETFSFSDVDGNRYDDWFVPTESAPYGEPPQFLWPVAAVTDAGPRLSWIEGPDWDVASGQLVGPSTLVVADAVTGAEHVRLDLGLADAQLLHADFDGVSWVGTFDTNPPPVTDGAAEPGADRVLIVDTSIEVPRAVDAGCPVGIAATLDRFGDSAPTPSPPPPTSTTVAPTTTQPVCPTYSPNDQYPIRLCDEGPAVRAVQEALAASGADIDVDGYFGPDTEAAVRRFQNGQGLGVDGLVGERTWAALSTFAAPPGTDLDGNGIIDPSEVGRGPVNPFAFVGQAYMVAGSGEVLEADGTPVPGLRWRSARDMSNDTTAQPFQAWHVSGPGTEYLWMVGMHVAEAPVTWQVTDLAELGPLAPDLRISFYCTHPAVTNVVAVVDASGQPATDSAWRFNTYTQQVEWINPTEVTCSG